MRTLALILLSTAVVAGCDVKDKSLGDSSSNADGGDPSDSDPSDGDPSDGDPGENCSLIGCESGLFLELTYDTLDDGLYEVELVNADTGEQHFRCDFQVQGGAPEDPDCLVFEEGGSLHLVLPFDVSNVEITVYRDRSVAGFVAAVVDFVEVFPNGEQCGPVCTQADLALALEGAPAVNCETLRSDFDAEAESVRECTDASECGQVLEGTSCGCTANLVARNDADVTTLYEIIGAAQALECEFAFFGGGCSCPEADGFDCRDNTCTWNYL